MTLRPASRSLFALALIAALVSACGGDEIDIEEAQAQFCTDVEAYVTALVRGDVYHSDENQLTINPSYRGLEGWQTRGVAIGAIDVKWPLIGGFLGGTQVLTPRVQLVATPVFVYPSGQPDADPSRSHSIAYPPSAIPMGCFSRCE